MGHRHLIQVLVWLIFLVVLSACDNGRANYDLAIKGGYIIDGSGDTGYHGDVLITNGQIDRIVDQDEKGYTATKVIDAQGLVISPGFIDVHAHGDPYATPEFENFLAMGVTTIFLGQDGSSPWVRDLKDLIGNDSLRCGVNVAWMAGHGTLRRGSGMEDEAGTAREIERLTDLVEDIMEAGCFGVSTGLEYLPGAHADAIELDGLAMAVGQHDGMIMSHLRSEDDDKLIQSLNELIVQGEYCRVHAAHLKSVYGKGADRAIDILEVLERAREKGVSITAGMYPYLASYTGIAILFPPWAKTTQDFEYAKVSRNKELRRHLETRVLSRNGPSAMLFGNPPFRGLTLEQVAEKSGKSFVDVLMNLGPETMSAAYFIMDEELQDRLFIAPYVVVGSDGSPTMHHPRGYGSFARVLRRYVLDKKLITLEQAIHKMTGLPAEITGLTNRGVVKEGMVADLCLIDTNKVNDLATFEDPHVFAEGFNYVIVNGKVARSSALDSIGLHGHMLNKRQLRNQKTGWIN